MRKVVITEAFVGFLLQHTTIMTLCSPDQILCLAADAYHPACFSMQEAVYDAELTHLKIRGLVY